jgi:hypothetical protein
LPLVSLFLLFFSSSCNKEQSYLQPSEGEKISLLVDKIANSNSYKELVEETIIMSISFSKKKLIINRNVSMAEIQHQLSTATDKESAIKILSASFNHPEEIFFASERLISLFQRLNQETGILTLTKEQYESVMERVFEHPASKAVFKSVLSKTATQGRIADCGGDCNQDYNLDMELAAYSLMVATGIGFLAGVVGGPAGMAAGAIGIVGSVAAYYLAADYLLEKLGICFQRCWNP